MPGLRIEWSAVIGWDGGSVPPADAVSDLLVLLVDELDTLGMEPDVSSKVVGDDLHIRIVAEFAFAGDPLDAMEYIIVKVKTAFHAAGIGTAGIDPAVVRGPDSRPVVRALRHGELTTV